MCIVTCPGQLGSVAYNIPHRVGKLFASLVTLVRSPWYTTSFPHVGRLSKKLCFEFDRNTLTHSVGF